jgi:hypothetical protein
MIIAVAGKYSAETEAERRQNFEAMNRAAARLLEVGHTPIIGVNAALPVVERANVPDDYEAIMQISMAVISVCEAILLISNSRGADRERDFFVANGKPVFYSVEDVPQNFPGVRGKSDES